ncbi:MAG: RluA family pseudouridine synthase [Planctomycetota bacterium]
MRPSGRDLSEKLTELVIEVRLRGRARLDLHLQQCLGWKSRARIQRLIELGRVDVNGQLAKASQRVTEGDRIRVAVVDGPDPTAPHSLPPDWSVPFWEDPYLLAINKPPHCLVHPVGRAVTGTVMNELHARYRSCNRAGQRPVVPKLCHRLDRETSGVLLVAKTDPARREVQRAFEDDRVRKEYLAIVEGEPATDRFDVDLPVAVRLDRGRSKGNRLATTAPDGRASLTHFEVLARLGGIALVRCRPRTGRQNQIRVHLAATGHPILGDTGYGSSAERWARGVGQAIATPFPGRALLHSVGLDFPHPIWGTRCQLNAPPPDDFGALIVAQGITTIPTAGPPLARSEPGPSPG